MVRSPECQGCGYGRYGCVTSAPKAPVGGVGCPGGSRGGRRLVVKAIATGFDSGKNGRVGRLFLMVEGRGN